MSTADNVRAILRTICIRKTSLPASVVQDLPSFRANTRKTVKEHFVQLDVIINSHAKHYANETFSDGVRTLRMLEEHFNIHGNIFRVSKKLNENKRLITREYLKGTLADDIQISRSLYNYIAEAFPIAIEHVDKLSNNNINYDVLSDLLDYIAWLKALKHY